MFKNFLNSFATMSLGMSVVVYGQFFINLGYYGLYPFISLYLLEQGVSPVMIGAILSARSGSNIVGMLIGGALTDRFGSKKTMNVNLLIAAAGYVSLIWASSPISFIVSFVIIGLFSGIAYPAESKIIIDNTDSSNRAEAYGMIRTAMNLAVALAPLIGISVFLKWPIVSYLGIAVIQVAYVIAVSVLIKEQPATVDEQNPPKTLAREFIEYNLVFRDGSFMYVLIAFTLSSVSFYMLETTLPMFLQHRFDNAEYWYTAIVMMNTYMVIFLQVFLTKLGKRFGHTKASAIGQLIYCLAIVGIAFSSNIWITLVAFAIFTVGEMLIAPSSFMILTEASKKDAMGKYQAIARLRLAVAQPISALLGGSALQYGGTYVMMFCYAAFSLVGAGMMFRSKKEEKPVTEANVVA